MKRNIDEAWFVRDLYYNLIKNQELVADIVGVSSRTVHRWIHNKNYKPSNLAREKIREIINIFELLREALLVDDIIEWLHTYNKLLRGEKPINQLAKRNYREVHDAASDLRDNIL